MVVGVGVGLCVGFGVFVGRAVGRGVGVAVAGRSGWRSASGSGSPRRRGRCWAGRRLTVAVGSAAALARVVGDDASTVWFDGPGVPVADSTPPSARGERTNAPSEHGREAHRRERPLAREPGTAEPTRGRRGRARERVRLRSGRSRGRVRRRRASDDEPRRGQVDRRRPPRRTRRASSAAASAARAALRPALRASGRGAAQGAADHVHADGGIHDVGRRGEEPRRWACGAAVAVAGVHAPPSAGTRAIAAAAARHRDEGDDRQVHGACPRDASTRRSRGWPSWSAWSAGLVRLVASASSSSGRRNAPRVGPNRTSPDTTNTPRNAYSWVTSDSSSATSAEDGADAVDRRAPCLRCDRPRSSSRWWMCERSGAERRAAVASSAGR